MQRQRRQVSGNAAFQVDVILRAERIREVEHLVELVVQAARFVQAALAQPGQFLIQAGFTRVLRRRLGKLLLQRILFPEQISQFFQSGALLAAQLPVGDAQLVGHHLLAELLDVAAKERIVDAPGARLVWLVRGGFEGFDAVNEDFSQRGRRLKLIGEIKKMHQCRMAQMIGVVQVKSAHREYCR